jgi:hypothetical protein
MMIHSASVIISLNIVAKKSDLRQVDNVAREYRMSKEQRQRFGRYLEDQKRHGGKDFTYDELRDLAKQFLDELGTPKGIENDGDSKN